MITSLINEHPRVVLTIYRGLSRTHDLQEDIIGKSGFQSMLSQCT
jgi:hypothetical protein